MHDNILYCHVTLKVFQQFNGRCSLWLFVWRQDSYRSDLDTQKDVREWSNDQIQMFFPPKFKQIAAKYPKSLKCHPHIAVRIPTVYLLVQPTHNLEIFKNKHSSCAQKSHTL